MGEGWRRAEEDGRGGKCREGPRRGREEEEEREVAG